MQDIYDVPKPSKDGIDSFCDSFLVESMKRDMKKIKQLLFSLGLLVAMLFAVSVVVAALAALAYFKPTTSQVSDSNIQSIVSSELLRILNESAPGPDQEEKFNVLQKMFMKNLTFQLEKLYLFQTNLSSINERVGNMKGRLDGLDLLLNTDLDSVREELVSLASYRNITAVIADVEMVRRDVSSLQTSTTNSINSVRTQISTLSSTQSRDQSSLSSRITNLEQQTTSSINTVTGQINTLRTTHSSDNTTLTNRITNLQQQTTASVNGVTSQVNTLRSTHSSDNSSLANRVASLQSTTTSLSSSISTINTRLSRSVNIYRSCYDASQTCTISAGADGGEYFKPFCQTSYLNINLSVSLMNFNHTILLVYANCAIHYRVIGLWI